MEDIISYVMQVLPTPGSPQQNKAELSDSLPRMPSTQFRYSSVRKSQSPTYSTRWALISRCRIQGSSGDSHARISALSSALPELPTLDTWLNEMLVFLTVLLNELVLLKELVLKELLLGKPLFSPTRYWDISLFCCSLRVVDSVYCGGFGEQVLKYCRVGSIDRVLEAEQQGGCCFTAALLANAWSNQLIQNMLPAHGAKFCARQKLTYLVYILLYRQTENTVSRRFTKQAQVV